MKYAKQNKLAAELVDELRKRVSDYVITESWDDNGWPCIALYESTPVADGEDNFFIRVRPRDWDLNKDIIGHDQIVYVPSVIQIACEAADGETTGLANFATPAHALAVFTTCTKRGTRVEYFEDDFGTEPTLTTVEDPTLLITSIEPELDWPLLASQ